MNKITLEKIDKELERIDNDLKELDKVTERIITNCKISIEEQVD